MSAKNIVYVSLIDTLSGGGGERVCLDIARHLAVLGHSSVVVSLDGILRMAAPKGVDYWGGDGDCFDVIGLFSLLESKYGKSFDFHFLFHLVGATNFYIDNKEAFHKKSARCSIFFHGPMCEVFGVRTPFSTFRFKHYLEFWRIHKVVSKSRLRIKKLREALAHGELYAVSRQILQECDSLGIAGVSLFRNGVDYREVQKSSIACCELLPRGKYIVHVARISKEKRQDMLLQAYASSGAVLPLVIIGDGPSLPELKQLSEELGITDRVLFKGFLQNPYPILAGARFSIICSKFEGFCLSALESLTLGVPVLMTDRPYGIRSELHNYPRELISPDSVHGLACKIGTLSDENLPCMRYELPFEAFDITREVCRFVDCSGI